VGQTTIVGLERLSGPPLTLRLVDVPERMALETLLRTASGYLAAPRRNAIERASAYDRILILPASAPVAASAGPAGRMPTPPPAFPAAGVQPVEEPDDASDMPEDQAPQPTAPVINPYQTGPRPPETTFDYANPQEMLRQRQQMLQQQLPQAQPPSPGTAVPGIIQPAAQPFFPGGAAPGSPPQMQPATSPGLAPGVSARPGEIVMPQQPQVTPYGLPPGVQPGSAVPPQMEPDRAKYLNPYAPAQPPRRPPDK
jgi:hypothetical protein